MSSGEAMVCGRGGGGGGVRGRERTKMPKTGPG